MKLRWIGVTLSLMTTGCATAQMPNDDVRSAANRCGLQGRISYRAVGERGLQVSHPHLSVKYEEADCFLTEVHRLATTRVFILSGI